MHINFSTISQCGRRSNNEDAFRVIEHTEQILDVFDFLCEKNGDDNYTAIMAIVEDVVNRLEDHVASVNTSVATTASTTIDDFHVRLNSHLRAL